MGKHAVIAVEVIGSAGSEVTSGAFSVCSFQHPKVDRQLFLPFPRCVIFSASVEATAFHKAAK